MKSKSMKESTDLKMGPSRSMKKNKGDNNILEDGNPKQGRVETNDSEGITLCTIFRTPGFHTYIRHSDKIISLEAHEARCARFCLDCPVCQVEKGSHLKPVGELQPLEVPSRK